MSILLSTLSIAVNAIAVTSIFVFITTPIISSSITIPQPEYLNRIYQIKKQKNDGAVSLNEENCSSS
jgi:hypothetical protein